LENLLEIGVLEEEYEGQNEESLKENLALFQKQISNKLGM